MRYFSKKTFTKIYKLFIGLPLVGALLFLNSSCSSTQMANDGNAPESMMFDTLLSTDNRATAVAIGASMGGHAGVIINDYMDMHANEVEERVGNVKLVRVAEGLVISYDTDFLFKENSDEWEYGVSASLDKLSRVLNKFEKTEIRILGHSSGVGAADFNYALSKARAEGLKNLFISNNIKEERIHASALGEFDPIVESHPNVADHFNSRIEIVIIADETLREEASNGMKQDVF